jgi:hypothetical protein
MPSASERPEGLVLRHDRDLEGRGWQIWVRRGLMLIPIGIVAAALLNVFGQVRATATSASTVATLTVDAPERLRSGLLFEARFDVHARSDIGDARLVLGEGWLEGMSINTVEPSPASETSRNGALELDLGRVRAGETYRLYMQFQVIPTNVGHRSADVALLDGETRLLTVDRTITVVP